MNQLTIFVLASIFYLATCASVKIIDFNFPVNGAKAVAVLRGTFNKSQILGTITFQQMSADDNLRVKVNITGIPQGLGPKHGLHIHRDAITAASLDTAEVCGSAGPHFNPLNSTHGHVDSSVRHVGDYGNVVSVNGVIMTEFDDKFSQLFGTFGIVGRTIILHQLEDDLGLGNNSGSTTTGNAGARIACGVIGLVA